MSKNHGRDASTPYSISQNFLTSAKIIRRLLARSTIGSEDLVLEIGCGKGHITRELAKVCRRVDAYEVDDRLYEQTQASLGGFENLSIHRQDFLVATLPKTGPYKVFSNIPFSITSDIVRKLVSVPNPPREAWLVMEKGAAMRFMGRPHDTLASIRIKPFFDAEIAYHFFRQDFHPMPSCDVVLLHLARKAQPDIPPQQQNAFVQFVENSRRYGLQRQLTRKQVSTALRLAGLPGIETAGEVLYVQWLCLFRCRCQFYGGKEKPPSASNRWPS